MKQKCARAKRLCLAGRLPIALLYLLLIGVTFVACGGGGDDDDGETEQPEATATATETATETGTPEPGVVDAPDPAGLQGPVGLALIGQGRSLVVALQALAVGADGTLAHYRFSMGSNTDDFESISLTMEYDTQALDFTGISLGVDPTKDGNICDQATHCEVNDQAGVVRISGLEPLQGRVFAEPDDAVLQQGESLDYIVSFTIAGAPSGAGATVQASVVGLSAAGEDAVGPVGEAFTHEEGDFRIEASFPPDVPQIDDTISPRVFLTNASGQSLQNVELSYIAAQPPGLEFVSGSCNTDVRATLPFGDLATIAILPDLEFCFTNNNFSSGRQLQLEASFTAESAAAFGQGARILLAARGKDGAGVVHLSRLIEATR